MHVEIKRTADGSATLFVPDLNEHYHSIHGAVQESNHVFLQNGLEEIPLNSLRILEMGFGTGLNALLTLMRSGPQKRIHYHSIEKYPLSADVVDALLYPAFLELDARYTELFTILHTCPWDKETRLTKYFSLKKIESDILEYKTQERFDLVYFDAFAPEVQPELWTGEIFHKVYAWTNKGGCLVTYCARGEVRRRMQEAGFIVERLPGPPGKREMIRARKKP